MADTQPAGQESAPPKPYAYGPGLLMIFGLALVVIAGWCGRDFFFPPDDWVKEGRSGAVWMNGIGMVAGVIGAAYCFVLAVIRSKKAKGDGAGAGPPPAA
jgi:hypothetical protein